MTLLFIHINFGQNLDHKIELHVINILGSKVYEKPTFDSQTLSKLEVGQNIIIEEIIKSNDQIEIGNGFNLSGSWIKPMKINGFVFSSDLTDENVEIGKNENGQTYINLLGKLINKKVEKKLIKTQNGEFSKYFEYKYYENGTYTYSVFDGCFDHMTEYKNLSISEVYHQMLSDYGGELEENDFIIPKFQEKSENYLKFLST